MSLKTEAEKIFGELRAELVKLFGDHANLHNVVGDAETKIHELHAKVDTDDVTDKVTPTDVQEAGPITESASAKEAAK